MSSCQYCGGEIIFRNIDGVTTPIRLSCTCGGWAESESKSKSKSVQFKDEGDYCRPTRCPECDDNVFFIRHNGGSVWVDELGWPWPKHPCFDSMPDAAPLKTLQMTASHLVGATGAVVTRVTFVQNDNGCVAEIAKPGAGKELWIVHGISAQSRLVGALVVFSSEERKIIVPGIGTYDISEPAVRCLVCNAPVLRRLISQHLAEKHGVEFCPTCRTLVGSREIDAHLRDHERNICPRGHGMLRKWEGVLRCWTCGWPFK